MSTGGQLAGHYVAGGANRFGYESAHGCHDASRERDESIEIAIPYAAFDVSEQPAAPPHYQFYGGTSVSAGDNMGRFSNPHGAKRSHSRSPESITPRNQCSPRKVLGLRLYEKPAVDNATPLKSPPKKSDKRGPLMANEPYPSASATVALHEAIALQGETLKALNRTERVMNHAEEIGLGSNAILAKDREAIEVIDSQLHETESVLKRASKDVTWFRRRMLQDKLFIVLFAIAACLSIAAIFVAIFHKRR